MTKVTRGSMMSEKFMNLLRSEDFLLVKQILDYSLEIDF